MRYKFGLPSLFTPLLRWLTSKCRANVDVPAAEGRRRKSDGSAVNFRDLVVAGVRVPCESRAWHSPIG